MAFTKYKTEIMDYIQKLQKDYVEKTDQRVIEWTLMESAVPMLSILATYLLIIYYGPKYMENRKPYNLKCVLLVYNIAQVVLSTYLSLEFFIVAINGNYGLMCDTLDYSDSEYPLRMARAHWLYYILKLIELLDTIFFVLRKKNNQISILHVYHHTIMAFSWYFVTRFYAVGAMYVLPMINSFIHVIMYSYYCLSALGPAIQPYLWWKKYLTKLQITQFFIIILHSGINCFVPDCEVPLPVILHSIVTTFIVAILFANFYYQSYIKTDSTNNNLDKKSK